MKKVMIFFGLFLIANIGVFAQVGINNDNSAPNGSAMLDVKSTTGGFLPPRMTTVQINGIAAPAQGLLVYNTDVNELYLYNGITWKRFNSTAGQNPGDMLYWNGTAWINLPASPTNGLSLTFCNGVPHWGPCLDYAVVTTSDVTSITAFAAVSGGNVTNNGGSTVTERGICLATTINPDIYDITFASGNGTGSFTTNLTGLAPSTTYYIRAYATNSSGTAYGNEVQFVTLNVPALTTTAVTAIQPSSAVSGGNVTNNGGTPVVARGVCYSLTINPSLANNVVTSGAGTGVFTSTLNNLLPNTSYFVRAWATNSGGTGYGEQVSFTTTHFSIGDSYGGGIIFYIDGTGLHGLIAATTDQSTSAEWGCYGTSIPGTGTAVGTGQTNTTLIVNGCSEAGRAARICNDLVLNGYDDWFLPSKDELNLMYDQQTVIGGFTSIYYWNSSQFNANAAWNQHFPSGFQTTNSKIATYSVRAVRAF